MTHDWLKTSGGFDVCARKRCHWQRRAAAQGDEYRTALTDWRPMAEPECPGLAHRDPLPAGVA